MTMQTSASAKIILFGEHAVVHGAPAIAVPVSDLRATAAVVPGGSGLTINALNLNRVLPVEVASDVVDDALVLAVRKTLDMLNTPPPDATIHLGATIPMASGLGSGAAISTALVRAVALAAGCSLSDAQVNELVYEVEKFHHGNPSGIDNTVIVFEKPVYFVRDQPPELLHITRPFTLVIGDTGHSALTKIVVKAVDGLVAAQPDRFALVIERIGKIVWSARRAIETGEVESLGPLMDENHALLRDLTVSSPELETLVQAARAAGAMGAKLSGGGRGGNMIALTGEDRIEQVVNALHGAGAVRVFATRVE